ncbi:hypothetical protein SH611_02795, partial [Geminicoccaceae bacterium 1502E]|nr:hypothetical protein [Geminicoccaceae bacterium 1502E]
MLSGPLGAYTYPAATAPRPHTPTDVGGQALDYDANGNMTAGLGRSIVYDHENRPVSVTKGGVTVAYAYGPDGARIEKTKGSETTLWLGAELEILPSGTTIKHVHADVRVVGRLGAGGVKEWLHRDHLASVRLITDEAGVRVQRSHYLPYGDRSGALT